MAARDFRSNRKRQQIQKYGKTSKIDDSGGGSRRPLTKKSPGSAKFYIEVYQDTQAYFKTHPRPLLPGSIVSCTTYADLKVDLALATGSPNLEIQNEDTLEIARRYVTTGQKVLVLNMASAFKAGGGVAHGRTAQEECLFQRSNAFQTHPTAAYPLQPDQAIYSPEVHVIKDSNFDLLDVRDQYTVGMISIPAIKNPKIVGDQYRNPEDRAHMEAKIKLIFECGITHGYQALVLGALGCGIYNNPPEEVAALFKAALQAYGNAFAQIGFAILKVGRNGAHNYKIFTQTLL